MRIIYRMTSSASVTSQCRCIELHHLLQWHQNYAPLPVSFRDYSEISGCSAWIDYSENSSCFAWIAIHVQLMSVVHLCSAVILSGQPIPQQHPRSWRSTDSPQHVAESSFWCEYMWRLINGEDLLGVDQHACFYQWTYVTLLSRNWKKNHSLSVFSLSAIDGLHSFLFSPFLLIGI